MKPRHFFATLGIAAALVAGCDTKKPEVQTPVAPTVQTYTVPVKPYVPYEEFRFTDETPLIFKHAERLNVEPELLMAIRTSENGAQGREYGIIPNARYAQDKGYIMNGTFYPYINETEKQVAWCARTIRNNIDRFALDPKGKDDFIDYLGDIYCPVGASNDPHGLNRHWEGNVRHFYEQYKN